MSQIDWLSHLLQMMTVTSQVEVRCVYGTPWRLAWAQSAAHEIPCHVVLKGSAIIEDPETETARELVAGDIVLLPHGSAHVLRDGSGHMPGRTYKRQGSAGWMLRGYDGGGEHLDMLCGRFFIGPPHDRLIRDHLPTTLMAFDDRRLGPCNERPGVSRRSCCQDQHHFDYTVAVAGPCFRQPMENAAR